MENDETTEQLNREISILETMIRNDRETIKMMTLTIQNLLENMKHQDRRINDLGNTIKSRKENDNPDQSPRNFTTKLITEI